jgi:hypothetical protein
VSATPLVSTCDSCVANVCATPGFGYCCTSAWDQFCVDETKRTCGRTTTTTTLGSGNNMCDYALMGAGAVALYGARVSGGDLGGGTGSNKISFSGSIPTQLGASVYSQGAMAIDSPSTVVGNAKAGGTLSGCSQVLGGTCTGATTVPNASVPTKTFTCPVMTAETFTADATLPSGAHGAITVNAGVKLTLQPGAYRVTSLTLLAGASLVMPSSGTVYFDSCGAVAFGAGATMTGFTSSAADAFRFQMYGNGNLTVGASAHLEGIFSFPTKSATLSAGADWSSGVTDIKGLVQASTVTMNQYTWIKADGIAGQNCLNNLIDQTLPGTCPMVVGSTAPPPGTGQCTHNDTGYKDPNVGSTAVDLALDMACGDNITVCNHGRADAPAGVQVGLYSRAGQQFAVEKPDENYRVGTCTVASTIAAGQCQTVACNPTLMSADLFAMVNPTGAVSEFSLLDNWTMHSTGSTCPATGSTKTYTYEYVATCPNDQSPLWGLLSWNTTTPGSSTVTFGARVAKTSAALSGSFTTLGVASAAGTDTQVCSKFSGDPGCPVDITGMLGLGKQQPSHLELQVVLDNIGSGATTAQSWDLNYTCVDDQ